MTEDTRVYCKKCARLRSSVFNYPTCLHPTLVSTHWSPSGEKTRQYTAHCIEYNKNYDCKDFIPASLLRRILNLAI